MTDYNDGNWYGWAGGDCPVDPKSLVEALWVDPQGEFNKLVLPAENLAWKGFHKSNLNDPISAFRVIKAYRSPREIWVGSISGVTSQYYQPGMVLFREVLDE